MAYCERADLENLFGAQNILDLVDDEKSGSMGATQLARVTRAISDADALIDGHMRVHYAVPLATTPALIRWLSEGLSVFNLLSRRVLSLGMPDAIAKRQADAMGILKGLASGTVDPGASTPPAASGAEVVRHSGPALLFTADTLKDF